MESQAPMGGPTRQKPPPKLRQIISLHPLLFAALFTLLIYQNLIPFSNLLELVQNLAVVLGMMLVLQLVFALLFRQAFKPGIAASVLCILCCSFGKLLAECTTWLQGTPWSFLARTRSLAAIEGTACLILLVLLHRTRRNLFLLNRYLNVLGIVLVLATSAGVWFTTCEAVVPLHKQFLPLHMPANPPDIYFILTDARTSPESLKNYWNYDDSAFVKFLNDQGFRVLKNAHGNSTATPICLATYLNMDYPGLPVGSPFGTSGGTAYYTWLIQNAAAPALLKASGYDFTNLSIFATAGQPAFYYFPDVSSASLAASLWEASVFGHLYEYRIMTSFADTNTKILSLLPEIAAQRPGRPKFVYAHIMMPHQPFLFDKDGRRILRGMRPADYRPELYLGQLIYENTLLTNTIAGILKNSSQPPIIILQGDHGFRYMWGPHRDEEATTILNALYLPGSKADWFYPGVTPVNTFRLIFNHYFGEHYRYLPDVSSLAPGFDPDK